MDAYQPAGSAPTWLESQLARFTLITSLSTAFPVQTSIQPPTEKPADAEVLRSEIARVADSKELMIVTALIARASGL